MKNDTIISFKLPKSFEKEISQYAHDHFITKSDFIRSAVIEKLQDINDSEFINKVMKKPRKTYTNEEVLLEFEI